MSADHKVSTPPSDAGTSERETLCKCCTPASLQRIHDRAAAPAAVGISGDSGETTAKIRPPAALPGAEAGTPLAKLVERAERAMTLRSDDFWSAVVVSVRRHGLDVVADFVAACSPTTIAALLADVARLQANWDEAFEVHESDKVEIIDLRATVAALTSEVRALREVKERIAIKSTENVIARHRAEKRTAAIVEAFDRWQMNGTSHNRVRLGEAIAAARLASPSPTGAPNDAR